MFRSTSLRLAAVYTVGFAIGVIALGLVTLTAIRHSLNSQFDARVRAESTALVEEYRTEGLNGVVQAVRERDGTRGSLDFGLQGPRREPVAGRLAAAQAELGWSIVHRPPPYRHKVRVLAVALPDGYRLLVGDDDEKIEALEDAVMRAFRWALAGMVLLGVGGGYALSRGVHRRLAAITGTAEAIIDGDLARRIPVRASDDDLDRLASTLNRMLDRISGLMESLKQVSSDVAHDLRTPLTRLRQRLEAGLSAAGEGAPAIEAALADLDSILETFAALLRIAQVESGARRAAFRACDLSEIAATVVEAFAPSAEDQRQALTLDAPAAVVIEGDAELLTQMLVNLVENALRHAGPATRIVVAAQAAPGGGGSLSVTDDGPGIPASERLKVFDRFYRLEQSRTTPGNGLGLAMAAAVARLHRADIDLADAAPGLRAQVRFAG
jgi:signal transduction histidine kinase